MLLRFAYPFILAPLLVVPTAPLTPVAAASFDCSKAATVTETAVCSHDDLSILDDTLAVAYATAIGGLSKSAMAQMRSNERAWVDFTEQSCTAGEEPLRGVPSDDVVSCINSNFFNRIRDLEQSRMLNGLRFYFVEAFDVFPADTEASGVDYIKVATKVYSSPRIDGDDALARDFNAFAEALLKTAMAGAGEGSGPTDRTSDVDTRVKLMAATASRITLQTTDWIYGHGAAHGNYTVSYAHYLPNEGRALVASDVFSGDDWVEPLAKLAAVALKVSLGSDLWEDLDEPLKEWVADPSRWDFSNEGLVLQFQPYEVTAYAAGAPTVTIPWGELQGLITDGAYSIATY